MTTQAIQWYANRLKEQEIGVKRGELSVKQNELALSSNELLETERHNAAVEAENYRHNLAYEEYQRQQLAEDARHNLAVEQETNRSNVAEEAIEDEKNDVSTKNAWITAAGRVAAGVIPRLVAAGLGAIGAAKAGASIASASGSGAGRLAPTGDLPPVTKPGNSGEFNWGSSLDQSRMSEDERWAAELKAERAARHAAEDAAKSKPDKGVRDPSVIQSAGQRVTQKWFSNGVPSSFGGWVNWIAGSILPLPALQAVFRNQGWDIDDEGHATYRGRDSDILIN